MSQNSQILLSHLPLSSPTLLHTTPTHNNHKNIYTPTPILQINKNIKKKQTTHTQTLLPLHKHLLHTKTNIKHILPNLHPQIKKQHQPNLKQNNKLYTKSNTKKQQSNLIKPTTPPHPPTNPHNSTLQISTRVLTKKHCVYKTYTSKPNKIIKQPNKTNNTARNQQKKKPNHHRPPAPNPLTPLPNHYIPIHTKLTI